MYTPIGFKRRKLVYYGLNNKNTKNLSYDGLLIRVFKNLSNKFREIKKINFKYYCISLYDKKNSLRKDKKKIDKSKFKYYQKIYNKISEELNLMETCLKKNLPYGVFCYEEKLTNAWNLIDRTNGLFPNSISENGYYFYDLEVSDDGLDVVYVGYGEDDDDSSAIKGNIEILSNNPIYYFEIKILNEGIEGFIGVGLAHINCLVDRLPGWEIYSFGYHGDDGHLFDCSGYGKKYGPRFSKKDVIGVCWNIIEKTVFFTKNGKALVRALINFSWFDLPLMVPLLGLRSKGGAISANFGKNFFEYDIQKYFVDFLKYRLPKIILFGKLEFIIKKKCKEKYIDQGLLEKTYPLKKINKSIIMDILKKKKIKKIVEFKFFILETEKNFISEKLDSIVITVLLGIINHTILKVKCVKKKFQIVFFSKTMTFSFKNIFISVLKYFVIYLSIFHRKKNHIRNFEKNFINFWNKKKNINRIFRSFPYKSIYEYSESSNSNAFYLFVIFFQNKIMNFNYYWFYMDLLVDLHGYSNLRA